MRSKRSEMVVVTTKQETKTKCYLMLSSCATHSSALSRSPSRPGNNVADRTKSGASSQPIKSNRFLFACHQRLINAALVQMNFVQLTILRTLLLETTTGMTQHSIFIYLLNHRQFWTVGTRYCPFSKPCRITH